jgi:hypothetical protein
VTEPVPHVDSGEIRETASPEDIPPDPEVEPPTEETESDKGGANGEEGEPEGAQTTGAFGQATYS